MPSPETTKVFVLAQLRAGVTPDAMPEKCRAAGYECPPRRTLYNWKASLRRVKKESPQPTTHSLVLLTQGAVSSGSEETHACDVGEEIAAVRHAIQQLDADMSAIQDAKTRMALRAQRVKLFERLAVLKEKAAPDDPNDTPEYREIAEGVRARLLEMFQAARRGEL